MGHAPSLWGGECIRSVHRKAYSSIVMRKSHRVPLLHRVHTPYIWRWTYPSSLSRVRNPYPWRGVSLVSMKAFAYISMWGYTLLMYRSVVSYLQARCRRRSLMCFSWICAAPCSCDIQLDLMATSPVFHYPSAPFSRLWTSVLACCEYPCVLLNTLVSYKNQHDCVACTICVFFVYVSAMQNASSARCSPFVNCRHLCENRIRSKSQSSVVIIIFKK